ncbi:MAG: glutamate--tRNA ligase [Pseudomonadota bacterium]|nr:glutamate--tRNA ligase [Pseudomonadota bacterium]
MTNPISAPQGGSLAGRPVRTRFAPSPTGFLHIGGARTALYAWAYARHHQGTFVLRIEDTDLQRSTPEAVQAILDGMAWLGLDPDEGPFYQTKRFDRYREVIDRMLADGTAYHCWASPAELDALRAEQRAAGAKPRYDGRWRPENAAGREKPAGVAPVVRFRNPDDGVVEWDDMVKGPIRIANAELDDLVIARADGSPTYNFCVVVDDWDMGITHVIRGDDHVNNTPRQINILRALGARIPVYGHVPMIHGDDGQKLSKRHGAVSVMQYDTDGFLPDAVVNYLARLGWSHGDDELFDRDAFVAWFDGSHLSASPSQFDTKKLRWLNNQYLRQLPDDELAARALPRIGRRLADTGTLVDDDPVDENRARAALEAAGVSLPAVCGLLKERAETLEELADLAMMFVTEPAVDAAELAAKMKPGSREALLAFAERVGAAGHSAEANAALIKTVCEEAGIKMPAFGMPIRLLVFGRAQTPAVDAVLALLPPERIAARIRQGLDRLSSDA